MATPEEYAAPAAAEPLASPDAAAGASASVDAPAAMSPGDAAKLYVRRADMPQTRRGGVAAGTWIVNKKATPRRAFRRDPGARAAGTASRCNSCSRCSKPPPTRSRARPRGLENDALENNSRERFFPSRVRTRPKRGARRDDAAEGGDPQKTRPPTATAFSGIPRRTTSRKR